MLPILRELLPAYYYWSQQEIQPSIRDLERHVAERNVTTGSDIVPDGRPWMRPSNGVVSIRDTEELLLKNP